MSCSNRIQINWTRRPAPPRRRGAIVVLAAALMVILLGMVAFALDVGYVLNARAEAQRAADAGAFAGAGTLVEGWAAAERTAHDFVRDNIVATRSVPDADVDVELGQWDEQSRRFAVSAGRPTAVKVVVQQSNQPLFFGRVLGREQFSVQAEAVATYAPRDIVVVLDCSASMNDDSELKHIGRLGRAHVESNLREIYEELGSPKFGAMQWKPVYIASTRTSDVIRALGLTRVPYPFPSGSWEDYIRYVQSASSMSSAGYRKRYGYLTLVNYWLERKPSADQTPGLWATSEQPITAVKDSLLVFLAYLQEMETDDRVGLAVYTSSDGEGTLESGLTEDLREIEDLSRQRQAGHYHSYTNIGAGMQKARIELEENGRKGALRLMVLMTDGIANRPSNTREAERFVLQEAQRAAQAGIPIVTVSLGSAADEDLMQQAADRTAGIHFNVPGGQSVAEYEEDLKDVFRRIAGHRPLKLVK